MANKPIPTPLMADLPTNWTRGQIVAPTGQEVGLPTNYGYNYLMAKVNAVSYTHLDVYKRQARYTAKTA